MALVSCWSGNGNVDGDRFLSKLGGWTYNSTPNTFFQQLAVNGRTYVNFGAGEFRREILHPASSTGLEFQINTFAASANASICDANVGGTGLIVRLGKNSTMYTLFSGGGGVPNSSDNLVPRVAGTPQRLTVRVYKDGGNLVIRVYAAGAVVFERIAAFAGSLTAAPTLFEVESNGNKNNDVMLWDSLSTVPALNPREYEITDHEMDTLNTQLVNCTGNSQTITDSSRSTTSATQGAASVTGTLIGSPTVVADAIAFSGAHGTASAGASQTQIAVTDTADTVLHSATVDVPEVAPRQGNIGLVQLGSTVALPGSTKYRFSTP